MGPAPLYLVQLAQDDSIAQQLCHQILLASHGLIAIYICLFATQYAVEPPNRVRNDLATVGRLYKLAWRSKSSIYQRPPRIPKMGDQVRFIRLDSLFPLETKRDH